MRRHIRAALAILTAAVVGLGATSCTSSPDAGNPADPGKGGGMDGAVNGDPRVTALLRSGIQQARQKHWATATTTFHSVLSIDPRNLYALYDLGVIAQTKTDA